MKRLLFVAILLVIPYNASAQVCQDITERMSDGSAAQRAAITARVKQLRDEGRDVYVTAKSTYSTIHAVCKPVPPPVPMAQCADGLDNDKDGFIDLNDPGCVTPSDNDETNVVTPPPAQCADGIDNDGDGLVDTADPGCSSSTDNDETNVVTPPPAQCADGIDNDKDGLIDLNDLGCSNAADNDETNVVTPPPGGDVVIDARFEENISRSDPNAAQLFLNTGIWSHVKTSQNSPGARGYIYTATTAPECPGPLPGGGQRVAVFEAMGAGGQTDFYLGYGSDVGPANAIPGDVWFQWWECQTPASRIGSRDKWLYPCNSGYGCHSHLWMFMRSCLTYLSSGDAPHGCGVAGNGGAFGVTRQSDGVSFIENTTGDPDARGNIGPQTTTPYLQPGRWNLVKIHYNTTNANSGVFEMWIKPQGGQFVKVADWKGGVTPGFTWTIPAASVGGHRVMRFPTTVDNDFKVYKDDFMMTRTEAALRQYQ